MSARDDAVRAVLADVLVVSDVDSGKLSDATKEQRAEAAAMLIVRARDAGQLRGWKWPIPARRGCGDERSGLSAPSRARWG